MVDTYADITDPTNPFAIHGISDEDRHLLQYVRDAKAATGVDVVVTCTTDHPAGNTRHLQPGTNGLGLAIDCRKRTRGVGIHLAVFELFRPIESLLYELIYSGATYSIKAGKRVPRYAIDTHWDHVHAAGYRGIMVRYPPRPAPAPIPPPPLPTLEDEDVFIAGDGKSGWLVMAGFRWWIQNPDELASLKAKHPYHEAATLLKTIPVAPGSPVPG